MQERIRLHICAFSKLRAQGAVSRARREFWKNLVKLWSVLDQNTVLRTGFDRGQRSRARFPGGDRSESANPAIRPVHCDFGKSRQNNKRCHPLRWRRIEASIVCHAYEGGEREIERRDFHTWHGVTVISGWTYRRIVWQERTDERDERRRGALTGSRRSISMLHLWQKNRDIGLPSTTASAMFYVSLSSPSLLAAVTVGSIWLRSGNLGSTRLGSARLGHGCNETM